MNENRGHQQQMKRKVQRFISLNMKLKLYEYLMKISIIFLACNPFRALDRLNVQQILIHTCTYLQTLYTYYKVHMCTSKMQVMAKRLGSAPNSCWCFQQSVCSRSNFDICVLLLRCSDPGSIQEGSGGSQEHPKPFICFETSIINKN